MWAEIANVGGVINWEHIPQTVAVVRSEEVGCQETEPLSLTPGGKCGTPPFLPPLTSLQFIPFPHCSPDLISLLPKGEA